eukprot:2216981-Pleurochrysis_carterae.AAC.1
MSCARMGENTVTFRSGGRDNSHAAPRLHGTLTQPHPLCAFPLRTHKIYRTVPVCSRCCQPPPPRSPMSFSHTRQSVQRFASPASAFAGGPRPMSTPRHPTQRAMHATAAVHRVAPEVAPAEKSESLDLRLRVRTQLRDGT